jgi:MoaA/NifB/PqqE/SkfB family radical SAM enzyme
MLDYLAERGIVTSITSNGLSTELLTDAELRRFRSLEFSLDFPTEPEHDAFRGQGNWRTVMRALERCGYIELPVTVTAVMMRQNYDKLSALAQVAASFGANLRVNVYQPSKTDRFSVSYEQFWEGFKQLLESTRLVATTEPVLAAVLGLENFAGPG